jgi:hypothetical protein
MQLEGFLRSADRFAGDAFNEISVLYQTTSARHSEAYRILANEYGDVTWVREQSFRDDLILCVDRDFPYTVFHTDDDVFYRSFARPTLLADEVTFSLRLGLNITYCYPLDRKEQLIAPSVTDDRLRWLLGDQVDGSFNYPLSVNGHVFRTEDVRRWIRWLRFESPNELEAGLQRVGFEDRPMMAAYVASSVVSIPANIVNDVYFNRSEWTFGIEELNERFLLGQRVDLEAMNFRHVSSTHQNIRYEFAPARPDLTPIFDAWARERSEWKQLRDEQSTRIKEQHEAIVFMNEQRKQWEQTARTYSATIERMQHEHSDEAD